MRDARFVDFKEPESGAEAGASELVNAEHFKTVQEEFERLKGEIENLRSFSRAVMESWPEGDLDGGDLQDIAEKHGLLKSETVTEPCGENCWCNYHGEFPAVCYKRAAWLLTPNAAVHRRGPDKE